MMKILFIAFLFVGCAGGNNAADLAETAEPSGVTSIDAVEKSDTNSKPDEVVTAKAVVEDSGDEAEAVVVKPEAKVIGIKTCNQNLSAMQYANRFDPFRIEFKAMFYDDGSVTTKARLTYDGNQERIKDESVVARADNDYILFPMPAEAIRVYQTQPIRALPYKMFIEYANKKDNTPIAFYPLAYEHPTNGTLGLGVLQPVSFIECKYEVSK